MSRIAGLVGPGVAEHADGPLAAMLAASRGAAGWRVTSIARANAAFGWCGWEAANIADGDGMTAVMDGAIYNRDALPPADNGAALLIRLAQQHGFADAVNRLNGDFAAALYDGRTGELWVARDRFGIKPLYYATAPHRFAFASRPRALFSVPGVSTEVDREWVARFAGSHYRYIDNRPERSPYAAIAQLAAAHLLRVTDGSVHVMRYWALEDEPDFAASEGELAERYRDLFLDAVQRRLAVAPRPVFTLSGGMDSSSVLAAAVRLHRGRRDAISTVYADRTYDESEEIRSMLADTAETWHQVTIDTPDVLALVDRMLDAHDEPVATATWLSHHLLCERAAALGFGSVFGGLGGDELNAGEYEHFLYFFADLRRHCAPGQFTREIDHWALHHDHPVFQKSRAVVDRDLARLTDAHRPGHCVADRARLHRYADAVARDFFDLASFEPVMEHPFQSYLKNRTYQDLTRETAPPCLRAEDRQTTASGMHHFLPFLDHRLVEFMFRVPGTLKIRDGVTKVLLREAMRGLLPEATRTRVKKTGWNAPAHIWFSGRGRTLLLDLVHSRSFRERGVYDVGRVVELVDEHDRIVASGRPGENHMMFLWQLLNLELWFGSLERLTPAAWANAGVAGVAGSAS